MSGLVSSLALPLELPALEPQAAEAVHSRWSHKTKPLGSLGHLEALAAHVASVQGSAHPALHRPVIMVFAGDHGAARHGISAYPQEVTWQMVMNFLAGGAAISVLARQLQCGLEVIDAGVNHDFAPSPGLVHRKIAHGTRSYLEQSAMTPAECRAAIQAGYQHAIESTADCLLLGEMGIGNTASASLLMHHLSGLPLEECVGPGTGLAGAGLRHKLERLHAATVFHALQPLHADPLTVLATFGGLEIAMLVGCILGAVQARKVVLIDGFIVSAAAWVAECLVPTLSERLIFAHQSAEPAHCKMLQALKAQPLLNLGLRLGEASGAALAWPLLKLSLDLLEQMATFEGAQVAEEAEVIESEEG